MAEIISANGRPISSIGLGSRVVMKAEPNSPVMTCIAPILPQDNNTTIIGWICAWFNVLYAPGMDADADALVSGHQFNTIQLPLQLIELAEEIVQ